MIGQDHNDCGENRIQEQNGGADTRIHVAERNKVGQRGQGKAQTWNAKLKEITPWQEQVLALNEQERQKEH